MLQPSQILRNFITSQQSLQYEPNVSSSMDERLEHGHVANTNMASLKRENPVKLMLIAECMRFGGFYDVHV